MNRRHDIDALRVLAFGVLILYHVGMFYVAGADWDWHIKSRYLGEWLQDPMLFFNRWRMSLLFLISGIAIGLYAPQASPARFARTRTLRLLVPLAVGMLAIVPVQAYCEGVSRGLVAPGFIPFMVRYLSFQPWPEGAFAGWQYGITWNHLWYLPYLWVYTLALCALLPLLHSGIGLRLLDRLTALRGMGLIFLPALPLFLYFAVLGSRFPPTHDLLNDWLNHAVYFTVFLYGYVMSRSAALWQEVVRLRWKTLSFALILFAAYLMWLRTTSDGMSEVLLAPGRLLRSLYMWSMLLALSGWAHELLNRPFRWLPYATEAVFPWYILHQTWIVLIGYHAASLRLGPVLEPLTVLIGTVAGCWVLHEIIRRIPLLRPLFGLKLRAAHAPPRQALPNCRPAN